MQSSSTTIALLYLLITSVTPEITEAARPLLTELSVTVTDLKAPEFFMVLTAARTSSTFALPDSFFAPSEKMKRSDSFASLQAASALYV